MYIKPFAVEEWMNEYEVGARFNIAETCVDSVSPDQLFALTGVDKQASSDVLLESVFCQLDADTPRSLHDLKGDPRANLLAIRLLFRQGRITGVLLDDPSGAEDQHGPLIYHAERLRVRRG